LVQGPDWLDFSFTRCAEVHICALTRARRIGVDVQAESPTAIARFCTAAERRRLAQCAPEERSRLLARLLTQKDALAKAVGAALAPPPDTIETPGDDEPGQAGIGGFGRLTLPNPLDHDNWRAATFAPVAGVIGAVVAEGEWTVSFATWSDARP
jgi:phosphopantetheinyl transferase